MKPILKRLIGTPDLLHVGTLLTRNKGLAQEIGCKIPVSMLEKVSNKTYKSTVAGPMRKVHGGVEPATHGLVVSRTAADSVQITSERHRLELRRGDWSPILEIKFKIGFLVYQGFRAKCRSFPYRWLAAGRHGAGRWLH